MYKTIAGVMTWNGIKNSVENYVLNCSICQKWKRGGKAYGLLPPSNPVLTPWSQVHVDLIGPYTQNKQKNSTMVMTMIDPVLRWIEIHPLPSKSSLNAALTFDREWLCRYPRPNACVHDNGGEFNGSMPTTVENPQANGILERAHAVIENMVRTTDLSDIDWTSRCQAVAFAIRSTYHTQLNASPAQLLFRRDMILDVAFVADIASMNARRIKQVQIANAEENASRLPFEYKKNDYVLLIKEKKNLGKLDQPTEGPFRILKVNSNGTLP